MSEPERVAWEKRTGWSAFDATKIWPQKDFPRQKVGVIELNRGPANYHAEVEQAAFSPSNIVPGLGFSPDKLLQGRLFAYHDTQLYRVGTNHQHLPVNAPRCPIHNQQRDGSMTIVNPGAAPNYMPIQPSVGRPLESGLVLEGTTGRYDGHLHNDHYSQAGALYRLMTDVDKVRTCDAIAEGLGQTPDDVQTRQLVHFDKADPAYGAGVRAALEKRRKATK
jgi:catalase